MKTKLITPIVLVLQTAFTFAQMNVSYSVVAPPAPCDSCVNLKANVTGGTPPYIYEWYQGCWWISFLDTGQYFAACRGDFQQFDSLTLLVTDAAAQQAGYCNTLSSILPPPSPITDIDFCIATVDSATGENLLVWEQSSDSLVVSYNIYKLNTSSVWEVIANVPRTSFSTFIDTSSEPSQVSAFYNLSTADSCGFGTPWSSGIATSTILLQISAGMPPAWNLSWNWSQGFPIVRYRILRGLTSGNITIIDSVANTIYAYTDLTPPPGTNYYAIEAVSSVQCNPSLKTQNVFSPYSSSFSNIASTDGTGVNELNDVSDISVFPIPAKEKIYVQQNTQGEIEIHLLDVVGRQLIETIKSNPDNYREQKTEIEVSGLSEGIYFLQVTTSQGTITKKIIIN